MGTETGFSERYTRYVKALFQVGPVDPADRDVRTGMLLELVARANPYTPGLNVLPVNLTWQGEPVANRQIKILHENGVVTRTTVTTDETGQALIPLSGDGEYLLNTVLMRAVEGEAVAWASHWATLSFKLQHDG